MSVKFRCDEHRPPEFEDGNWWATLEGMSLDCQHEGCEAKAAAVYYIDDDVIVDQGDG